VEKSASQACQYSQDYKHCLENTHRVSLQALGFYDHRSGDLPQLFSEPGRCLWYYLGIETLQNLRSSSPPSCGRTDGRSLMLYDAIDARCAFSQKNQVKNMIKPMAYKVCTWYTWLFRKIYFPSHQAELSTPSSIATSYPLPPLALRIRSLLVTREKLHSGVTYKVSASLLIRLPQW
jgi:hypothetical protein